ncbi:MAG TPA: STN domain-containing protein, partial [Sphingobacteriaceae bacterium]
MKLITLIFFTAIMQLHAAVYSQSTFSFSKPNTTVKEMFKEIERSTDYTIFYRQDYVNLKKNIRVITHNESIEEVMKKVLRDQPLTFEVVDKVIIIKSIDQNNAAASVI